MNYVIVALEDLPASKFFRSEFTRVIYDLQPGTAALWDVDSAAQQQALQNQLSSKVRIVNRHMDGKRRLRTKKLTSHDGVLQVAVTCEHWEDDYGERP